MGTAAASAGAAGPSEGLRAGRSSGRTKPYTPASGRHDHATFGSGPTRQSDDWDSEPDYLLRPTRHGLGGTLLDYSAFSFRVQVTEYTVGTKHSKEIAATASSQQGYITFESAINTDCSFGC